MKKKIVITTLFLDPSDVDIKEIEDETLKEQKERLEEQEETAKKIMVKHGYTYIFNNTQIIYFYDNTITKCSKNVQPVNM